jgi:hypothetical protein
MSLIVDLVKSPIERAVYIPAHDSTPSNRIRVGNIIYRFPMDFEPSRISADLAWLRGEGCNDAVIEQVIDLIELCRVSWMHVDPLPPIKLKRQPPPPGMVYCAGCNTDRPIDHFPMGKRSRLKGCNACRLKDSTRKASLASARATAKALRDAAAVDPIKVAAKARIAARKAAKAFLEPSK